MLATVYLRIGFVMVITTVVTIVMKENAQLPCHPQLVCVYA